MPFRFHWRCPECGDRVKANSPKSLSSARDRHRRERHLPNAGQGIANRRQQQATRQRVVRGIASGGINRDEHPNCLLFVTCPDYRMDHHDATFAGMIEAGFEAREVHRRRGIDFSQYLNDLQAAGDGIARVGSQRLPRGLRKNTFLMFDFHRFFLPLVLSKFSEDASLEWCFWVEDDCSFAGRDATIASQVLACAASLRASGACWMGYSRRKGAPRYQSHLVALSRTGAEAMAEHLDETANAAKQAGDHLAYLEGLDTFLHKAQKTTKYGRPLVVAAPTSMARQRKHTRVGRN